MDKQDKMQTMITKVGGRDHHRTEGAAYRQISNLEIRMFPRSMLRCIVRRRRAFVKIQQAYQLIIEVLAEIRIEMRGPGSEKSLKCLKNKM